MDKAINVAMNREVVVDEYVVAIALNLNYVPAQWQFQLLVEDPNHSRTGLQRPGDNGILVLEAPIDSGKKDQISTWLKSFPVKIPYWTLMRDTIVMIVELKKEEVQAREDHELVKQHMAKKDAKQDPPQ